MIKILVISDTVDQLIYSNNIKKRFQDISFVISCGDLPFYYYDFIMTNLNVPLFYVLGNHPPPVKENRNQLWDADYPPGAENIDSKIINYKGLLIGGFEGSIRYNNDQWSKQYTNFEMKMKHLKMWPKLIFNRIFRGRALDILVTHAPPRGIQDREDRPHRGFKSYLSFLKRFKPRYMFHGHIHLYDINEQRETLYNGRTRVINGYGYQIIEIEDA